MIESLAEGFALMRKAGVDPQKFLEVLTESMFSAPVYKTYGTLIADKKFKPAGFAAPLGLKDARLAIAAGEGLRVPLPLANLVRDRFLRLLARGDETLDWSAISQLAGTGATCSLSPGGCRPRAAWRIRSQANQMGSGPDCLTRRARSMPSTYSIAM